MRRNVLSSGIPSLDRIIDGGFNEGDVILVAGQPGAGKSTLGMQFIYNGVSLLNEPGIYASFVESAAKLKRDMLRLGWDLDKLGQGGKLSVLDLVQSASDRGVEANLAELISSITELGAKRLVVDSLSAIMTYVHTRSEARSFISMMSKLLSNTGCTTLLILEIPWGKREIGMGFEEFLADGLIILESSLEENKVRRRIYIPKMRGVDHSLDCHDFYITSEGISVSSIPAASR
ncbi:MAG: ATPase domain-containing protein [Promethearchaeati archaeon SRVP18_Atabeyarchaeia-1]